MPNAHKTDDAKARRRSQVIATKALQAASRKEVRFLLVGGWNTAFGYLVFVALQLTVGETIGYMGVLVIAQILSIANAYLCYRWLVFRVRGHWWLDFIRFSTVYWILFGVNVVYLPIMVSGFGFNPIVAQTIYLIVIVVTSYVLHNRFSFRRSQPPAR